MKRRNWLYVTAIALVIVALIVRIGTSNLEPFSSPQPLLEIEADTRRIRAVSSDVCEWQINVCTAPTCGVCCVNAHRVLSGWNGVAVVEWATIGEDPQEGDCACVEIHGCGVSWREDTTVAALCLVFLPLVMRE